jgi:hypothetical protein
MSSEFVDEPQTQLPWGLREVTLPWSSSCFGEDLKCGLGGKKDNWEVGDWVPGRTVSSPFYMTLDKPLALWNPLPI